MQARIYGLLKSPWWGENASGTFRFSAALNQEGVVEIRQKGFKPYVTHVKVSSRSVKPIVAVLEVADLAQNIEVTVGTEAGQVSADAAENRDAAVVNDNMLERVS